MTLKDRIAADLESVFYNTDEFAVAAEYTPASGTKRDIRVVADYGDGDEYRGADSYGVRCTMRIRTSEVAQPARSDRVTINGVSWIVIGADPSDDGLEWIVQANKVTK